MASAEPGVHQHGDGGEPPEGVRVAVDTPLLHLDRPFTYRVPPELTRAGIAVPFGARVKVPFGGRKSVDGWVIGHTDDLVYGIKDVLKVVSPLPAFDRATFTLARWVADRYVSTLSDALRLVLPPRIAAVEKGRQPPEPERRRASRARLADGLPASGVVWWRPLPGEDRGKRIADLVEAALARGLGAIVVVPEVVAGSPVADTLRARLGGEALADLAGAGSDRLRYQLWLDLAEGSRRVALGGRSTVFAPVSQLGLVVVDDEASHALKEQRTPRYHAREVAVERAREARALCLLTSTVASSAVVAAVKERRWKPLLPSRGRVRRAAPFVEVVNPDDEGPAGARLHPRALRVLRDALAREESAYVLVPRRGGAEGSAPFARTAGQVAAQLGRVLPRAAVWRLDREVIEAGERPPWADASHGIVVGTVAGVKDRPPLPRCRTVVVVAADAAFGQAEVRAAEEALRTWCRAAAWCGPRGRGGHMVVQARDGGHHALQALTRWDPDHFWRRELPRRAELGFPPVRALVLAEGPDPAEGQAALDLLTAALGPKAELLGPAPMGKGWRIIAKVDDAPAAARALRPPLAEAARTGSPRLSVELDPLEVLAAPRGGGT
jgi:primosomal protein N' (replication factor Y)